MVKITTYFLNVKPVNVYGKLELPQYKGIGKEPFPRLIPVEDLKYVKVCKKKVKGYVIEAIQRIIFGDPEEIFEILEANVDDYIGTSYIERINFTIRTSLQDS